MSLRHTIPYFSPLVDHVICSLQTNDSHSFTKGFDSGNIHGIHNGAQSIGPVMLVTQGCYDAHKRTTDLFSAIGRPRSGIQASYISPLLSSRSFTSCCCTVMLGNIDAVVWACSGVVVTARYDLHVRTTHYPVLLITSCPQYQPLSHSSSFLLLSISQVMNQISEVP